MYPSSGVPQQVLDRAARAGRRIRWLLLVQLALFVVFVIGGADLVWTLARNGGSELTNCGAAIAGSGHCGGHHSYRVPVGLLAVGFFGFLLNGYFMAWLARRYLGQAGRWLMGPRRGWGSTTTVTFGAPIRGDDGPPPPPRRFEAVTPGTTVRVRFRG